EIQTKTRIAGVAARLDRFVEMSDQRLVAAATPLQHAEQVNRAGARLIAQRIIGDVGQKRVVANHVGPRVKNDAIARQTIATSATDLLIPRLDARWHIPM